MKAPLIAVLCWIAATLTACAWLDGDSTNPPTPTPVASAKIACVDVHNGSGGGRCAVGKAAAPAATRAALAVLGIGEAQAADQTIDGGTVTRAQLIEVSQLVTNLTATPFTGYVEARFDAGCNGASEWQIMPKQAIEVAAGGSVDLSVAGSCGDMPLGARKLEAKAYGPDGETVIDTATVNFTLIE